MASEPALVDGVRDITPERRTAARARGGAAKDVLRVRFAGGATGRLDTTNPRDRVWADVLQSSREAKQPVYVVIDPDTSHITSLLLPQEFTVAAIREADGALEVDLEISQARHYLHRDHANFEQMRSTLEEARRARTPLLITESLDAATIIDVRPATPPPSRRRK